MSQTVELGNGITITGNFLVQPLADWQKEMQRRFLNRDDAAFQCPRCGHVASIADFKAAGIDEQAACQECIGRHLPGVGCDWAAYGLLGTLGKGRVLILPDGSKVQVFDFAPEVQS